jgi:hypothetical protein
MDWFYRGENFELELLKCVKELLSENRSSDTGLKKSGYTKLAEWMTGRLRENGAPIEWIVTYI